MNFTNTYVSNFEGAFRGLRNPLQSWTKSDSKFGLDFLNSSEQEYKIANLYAEKENNVIPYSKEKYSKWLRDNGILNIDYIKNIFEYAYIGPNDLNLAQRMIKAGASDSKFLRQIFVSVDITAPLYW